MTGSNVDPLEHALTTYFRCRGAARDALPSICDHVKHCPDLRQSAYRLQSALVSYAMMTRREEADAARLLQALENDITSGTREQYVGDEYSMSGGGYETVLTEQARDLSKVARHLQELQSAWQQVQQAIAVDRELQRLRG